MIMKVFLSVSLDPLLVGKERIVFCFDLPGLMFKLSPSFISTGKAIKL